MDNDPSACPQPHLCQCTYICVLKNRNAKSNRSGRLLTASISVQNDGDVKNVHHAIGVDVDLASCSSRPPGA